MVTFRALRVVAVRPEAEDALAITFAVPEPLRMEFRGTPGQHIVVRALDGAGELRRTYSLTNAPDAEQLRILVRRQPHGRLSQWLTGLVPGMTLDVLPPRGSFTPRAETLAQRLYVAFAAGSGITPVLSVTRAVLAAGGTMLLFYGNRCTARAMGLEDLQALKDLYPAQLALHFVMSAEPQELLLYNGRIDATKVRLFARAFFEPRRVHEAFVCGPGDMAAQVTEALHALGVDARRIHVEHFAVAGERIDTPVAIAAEAAVGRAEVGVILDGRRRAFTMSIGADTVLEAAERAGIELPFSCRSGVCSTCRVRVVRGQVRMAQNYALEDWELDQGYVLACQSLCRSAQLELDYDDP